MILEPVFEPFINDSPLTVMSRATIEYALSASFLDNVFERTAQRCYTRELHFSTIVDLMGCDRAIPGVLACPALAFSQKPGGSISQASGLGM
jgi:hypothetical protein